MGKYVIESKFENTRCFLEVACENREPYFFINRVDSLTPYTEPDLEQVRKEAYEAGAESSAVVIADDKAHEAYKLGYENGLNDLWEAMQKAIKMYCEIDNEVFLRVFHDVKCDWGESVLQALFKNTPQHLIDSIRKYEQRQEKEFKVGDEFENESGKKFVVLKMNGKEIDRYIDVDGKTYLMSAKYTVMRKTGRHFSEIASVLEQMRGENND